MQRTIKALKNTVYQVIARLYSSVMGFLTTLLIISFAGDSVYGDYAKVTALLAIGYTTLDFGLNAHILRKISSLSSSLQRLYLSNLLYLRLFLSILISLAILGSVYLLSISNPAEYGENVIISLFIGLITIFTQSIHLSSNALFQHQEKYFKTTITVTLGATVGFILTAFYSLTSPSLVNLTLAMVAGYLITSLASLYYLRDHLVVRINIPKIISILKGSGSLALVLIFSTIAGRSDILIQSLFQSSSTIAEYAFAYKIFDFALILPVFLMNSLYPSILKNINDYDKTRRDLLKITKVLGGIALLGTVFIFFTSPLIYIFRPSYEVAVSSFRVLGFSLPLFYLTAPMMWIIVSRKHEKYLIPVYFIAVIANILLNYYLSPLFGIISASYITIATELIIMVGLLLIIRKHETN